MVSCSVGMEESEKASMELAGDRDATGASDPRGPHPRRLHGDLPPHPSRDFPFQGALVFQHGDSWHCESC